MVEVNDCLYQLLRNLESYLIACIIDYLEVYAQLIAIGKEIDKTAVEARRPFILTENWQSRNVHNNRVDRSG